jgi:hypothetical protein
LVYTSCVDDPELRRGTESLHGEVGVGGWAPEAVWKLWRK